jgi:tryptophan synthase alpha chain
MSRLTSTFTALSARGEKALVCFVTAGDPLPNATTDIICAIAEAGADVIELGVPFSDPLADGPTIQEASFRALQHGMTPPKVLEIVREVRQRGVTQPIVLMGAWNPILQYGMERFAQDAIAAGVDGTIVTDMIPEEATVWKAISAAAGLDTVFLLAPTSNTARMQAVAQMASGFVYCVSMTGITGTKAVEAASLPDLVAQIRAHVPDVPVCVGFGIQTPQHVREIVAFADGAVVGSSLVSLLHQNRDEADLLSTARTYVSTLKAATLSNQ